MSKLLYFQLSLFTIVYKPKYDFLYAFSPLIMTFCMLFLVYYDFLYAFFSLL